jgi:hypothetical protein
VLIADLHVNVLTVQSWNVRLNHQPISLLVHFDLGPRWAAKAEGPLPAQQVAGAAEGTRAAEHARAEKALDQPIHVFADAPHQREGARLTEPTRTAHPAARWASRHALAGAAALTLHALPSLFSLAAWGGPRS